MSFASGQHGSMWIKVGSGNSEKAGQVQGWSVNSAMTPLGATTLECTDQVFIPGLRTTTGTCTLFYYGNNSSAAKLLHNVMKTRSTSTTDSAGVAGSSQDNVTFKLKVAGAGEIEVEALITACAMSMSVGEVLSCSLQFQVIGAPVAVTL